MQAERMRLLIQQPQGSQHRCWCLVMLFPLLPTAMQQLQQRQPQSAPVMPLRQVLLYSVPVMRQITALLMLQGH